MNRLKMLKQEESWKCVPYYCVNNYPTIGYGFKIGNRGDPLPKFSLTKKVGDAWLRDNINTISLLLATRFEWYTALKDSRKCVILSMAYQMGIEGFSKFVNTIRYISRDQFKHAAIEMLDSKWAREDTPGRAKRHSKQFATGYWSTYYS